LALYGLYLVMRNQFEQQRLYLTLLIGAVFLPHLANATGWLFTEIARQPWIVFGLQKTADAVSPNVSTGMVLFSLIGFTLVYAVLMVANIYLLLKFARGSAGESSSQAAEPAELPGGTPAHAYLK
jgi:cytochrome d ubiquinol oxidase subunit I